MIDLFEHTPDVATAEGLVHDQLRRERAHEPNGARVLQQVDGLRLQKLELDARAKAHSDAVAAKLFPRCHDPGTLAGVAGSNAPAS